MMKNIMDQNKGITMISVTIIVIVILILTGVLIYDARDSLKVTKLQSMQSDIQNLRDKISNYYAQYGQIPARIKYTNTDNIGKIMTTGVISPKIDTGDFYIIELSSLENLTLNYGEDYKNITNATTESEASQYEDIYIINETSQNIFYVEGIQVDGEWFYTDYTSEDVDTVAVNLRYFDGVKIPDGYIYNSGTSKEDLSIKNESDTTKIYNWVITDEDITEIPADVQIEETEQAKFIESANLFNGYYKSSTDNTVIYIVNEEKWSLKYDKNGEYKDKNGDVATVPAGFQVSETLGMNTIKEGLVIQDEEENQFVWIPVDDINDIAKETSNENGNTNYEGKLYDFTSTSAKEKETYGVGTESNREPDIISDDNNGDNLYIINNLLGTTYLNSSELKNTLQEDYNTIIKSISTYHGFYVGRYEISKSSNNIAQSKPDNTVLTTETESANKWYGLYAYGKTYNTSSVGSSMIWGSQYDAIMRWMQKERIDVTDIGTSNQTLKNIYDLCDGYYELTLEASGENRVARGVSDSDSTNSVSSRIDTIPDGQLGSSRFILYIVVEK